MLVTFPRVLSIDLRTSCGNRISQLLEPAKKQSGQAVPFSRGKISGFLFQPDTGAEEVLIVPKAGVALDGHPRIIEATINGDNPEADLSELMWLRHPNIRRQDESIDFDREIQRVLDSWVRAFSYIIEDREQNIIGLRTPQVGAIHAVHAHWAVSNEVATVVMPTGTGKTETMLSVMVTTPCPRVLVVVPTDALRAQISEKFCSLGVLKHPNAELLLESAKRPIVCTLEHLPADVAAVDRICKRAQVIVTTSHIAGQCSPDVQKRLAEHCPYLFIDEAHHAEASTWRAFRERFRECRVLQFTATPFREDGKPLDGQMIFKYPLKKAQEEEYFKPIRFVPVIEFQQRQADAAIAEKAIAQLRCDADKGHILMARVETVERARQVFEHYKPYTEFKPVELHSGIKAAAARNKARQQIITGESRVVVCVDMLGEGFDLPELKIAAFHDIRKSLAVTLQLAGRFTRFRPDLGDAVFIANTADVVVRDELRKLYRQDPDWNVLLPELSEKTIGEQLSLQKFLEGFTAFTTDIPLNSVQPATSMVVYKTSCVEWSPESFRSGIPALNTCEQVHHAVNDKDRTLIIVTARKVALHWADVDTLFSWDWELYVVVWSQEQNLLFINSSTNAGEYKALAHAVAGESASLIRGEEVFRSFAGINRLRLQNAGLTEQIGRNVRYTGSMGADVEPGIPLTRRNRAIKSVLSGSGFENGELTTIGASRKGRIWSHRRENLNRLVQWCKHIGNKVTDVTIDPDEVLKGTLQARPITVRPNKMPICVDWPEEFYKSLESQWLFSIENKDYGLWDLSLELISPDTSGALRFALAGKNARAEFELQLLGDETSPEYRFVPLDYHVKVKRGIRSESIDAPAFFYDEPPKIWFADGSSLEGNQYVEAKIEFPPFDASRIDAWAWKDINIRKESQGTIKAEDSIQHRVIQVLRERAYAIVMDDDDSGEAADVVAIQLVGDLAAPERIELEFYHCKFSLDDEPGARIKDLYEVCGQAQKSVHWMWSPERRTDLFTHLLRRDADRIDRTGCSRFEVGDRDLLVAMREVSRLCPVTLRVFIVQPGVSKQKVSRDQLQLMAVTENYLAETYQVPFGVIGSP